MSIDILYKYKNKLFEGTIIKYNNSINNIGLLNRITYFSDLLFPISQRDEKVSYAADKNTKIQLKKDR